MGCVDQNGREGRDRLQYLQSAVENEAEKLPVHHCWKCVCFPAESEIHSSFLNFPDSSVDNN